MSDTPQHVTRLTSLRLSVLSAVVMVVIAVIASRYFLADGGVAPHESNEKSTAELQEIRLKVTTFCGDCHTVPAPDTFPREAWEHEVRQGYGFYQASKRTDLEVPPVRDVIAYYESQAPERLDISHVDDDDQPAKLRFRKTSMPLRTDGKFPAVSDLLWLPPSVGKDGKLLFCDMNSGHLASVTADGEYLVRSLEAISNPAHLEPCDLNGDGELDLLVADLASLMPEDHARGKIVWLPSVSLEGDIRPVVLQDGLARVSDVRPGDFDGDGDLDLVVAEFGWITTGRILLLECIGFKGDVPEFRMRVLDKRHGAIHVPTADLNGDGHLDFVALVSQEYETIEAFLNNGDGTFRREPIFAAGNPSFGSSGIQLIDLDADGDLDLIYTNGDSMDSFYLKPYHAIHWLENRGTFPFQHHLLANMPGVYQARAGDLDGDGDLDIVACGYIPHERDLKNYPGNKPSTLIWLEQQKPGEFVRRPLWSNYGHVALEVLDFDGDGDLDLAVGNYFQTKLDPWLTVWWNLTKDEP